MNVRTVNKNRLLESVQNLTREFAEKGYFPSAVIRVFDVHQTLTVVTHGDVRPGTVFDVASLTKIATATQALLLSQRGALRLTDRVLSRLPELSEDALLAERLAGVTLEKLLTHTSGIVGWYPFYAAGGDFAGALRAALTRYGPVEGVVYSDLNFMLLGKVVERACGAPLDACMKRLLVDPLGLGKMAYNPDKAWDIAPSCYGNPIEEAMCAERGIAFSGWRPHTETRGEANDGNAHYYFGGVAGSAGVFAEAEAYEKLARFHMKADAEPFLSAQTERAPGRGLGWQRGDLYPEGCGHTGFTGTSVYISRALNIGVVAFTNRLFYEAPNPNPTNDFRRALHHAAAALAREV